MSEDVDAYIERIKKIKWFRPVKGWSEEDATKQVHIALEAFGMEASVEYRELEDWDAAVSLAWDAVRRADWDAARVVAMHAAMDAAWEVALGAAARGAARDAAMDAAIGAAMGDAARDAAWDAAIDAARGAQETLVMDVESFQNRYPNGAFLQLIPLWEMGLYPCGVIDGKFFIYVPKH